MRKLSRILSAVSASAFSLSLLLGTVSSASPNSIPRDPNRNGEIRINDAVYIMQFLGGAVLPSNLTPLDFDQNGVITLMDSYKIKAYLMRLLTDRDVPMSDTNDPVVTPQTNTLTYRRHNCSSTNPKSYTSYNLTTALTDVYPSTYINIIGDNDMVRDSDTAVVRLAYKNEKGEYTHMATGFIINDHTVLTAAHCVYNKKSSNFYDMRMDIIGEGTTVLGSYYPEYIHIPKKYAFDWGNGDLNEEYEWQNDYAMLYFDEDLSQYGKFDMGYCLDQYIDEKGKIVLSGFPHKTPDGYEGTDGKLRFKSAGNLERCREAYENTLVYDADAFNGHSGSPVYVEEGMFIGENYSEYKSIIGINNGGFIEVRNVDGDSVFYVGNRATRITPDIIYFAIQNDFLTE